MTRPAAPPVLLAGLLAAGAAPVNLTRERTLADVRVAVAKHIQPERFVTVVVGAAQGE